MIKKIIKKRISDEVLAQMERQIIDGDWKSGDKIPAEMELTKLFGVSRVSVREAIHRLVGMGVLSIKRGEGTFVNQVMPSDYFKSLLPALMIDDVSLFEILEFRKIVEIQSAYLAAQKRDDKDIKILEDILNQMKNKSIKVKEFAKFDLDFHTQIAISTHNTIIIRVNAILHDLLETAMDEIVKATGFEDGIYYHKKMLSAIKDKDEILAQDIMKEHIQKTIEKMKI